MVIEARLYTFERQNNVTTMLERTYTVILYLWVALWYHRRRRRALAMVNDFLPSLSELFHCTCFSRYILYSPFSGLHCFIISSKWFEEMERWYVEPTCEFELVITFLLCPEISMPANQDIIWALTLILRLYYHAMQLPPKIKRGVHISKQGISSDLVDGGHKALLSRLAWRETEFMQYSKSQSNCRCSSPINLKVKS